MTLEDVAWTVLAIVYLMTLLYIFFRVQAEDYDWWHNGGYERHLKETQEEELAYRDTRLMLEKEREEKQARLQAKWDARILKIRNKNKK